MQRRMKLVDAKIRKHLLSDDKVKLRKYHRAKWALYGITNHDFDFNVIRIVHLKFKELDMVPSGYLYPEFYLY